MQETERSERVKHRLNVVRIIGWVDLIFLIALVYASLSGQRNLVSILGPLHGINFLVLVVIVVTAAIDGVWSWWFPAAVFFTGGALGALGGEWLVSRRLAATKGTEQL